MEKETLNAFIIRIFKEWIKINNPKNVFVTQVGILKAEDILKQLEEETIWEQEFINLARAKCMFTSQGFNAAALENYSQKVKEENAICAVSDLMNKMLSFPPGTI
ncbi:MAG: hypothetical protein ACOYMB_05200 [Patescibacteria group bacterium]